MAIPAGDTVTASFLFERWGVAHADEEGMVISDALLPTTTPQEAVIDVVIEGFGGWLGAPSPRPLRKGVGHARWRCTTASERRRLRLRWVPTDAEFDSAHAGWDALESASALLGLEQEGVPSLLVD
jgi:hypothetical protein